MLKKIIRRFFFDPKYAEAKKESEVEFVFNRCIAESKDGHFPQFYSLPIPQILGGLKNQILCAINDHPFPFEPNNPRNGTGAKPLLIYIRKNLVGFFILLEHMPGSWNEKIEIHLISILPKHRNNGLGKKVINDILKLTPAREIYARCYIQSKAMMSVLRSAGFVTTEISSQGTETLTLKR